MLEYVSGVPLLESGNPTPAQIKIQEEKERQRQAFQESLEREAKKTADRQEFIDEHQKMIDNNMNNTHQK